MIGFDRVRGLVMLLLAEAEEALNGRATVSAVDPLTRRAPSEFCGLWCPGQRLARAEQSLDIDTIIDWFRGSCRHWFSPGYFSEKDERRLLL